MSRSPAPAGARRCRPASSFSPTGPCIEGFGLGATGHAVGEVCFNTAMTGYEEILTDPSYAGQIVTFTFPHIGNVGTNEEDIETVNMAARAGPARRHRACRHHRPANHRATRHLDAWLKARGIVGLGGIDTRALTAFIRENGMPNAVIAHAADGKFDRRGAERRRPPPGRASTAWISVPSVTTAQRFTWDETTWQLGIGYGRRSASRTTTSSPSTMASRATSCGSSPMPAAP